MNYALDALWWKLTARPVRDLAALLTAPPLWHSGHELSVRELLGEHGFRYLLKLDQNPQPLADYLMQHTPFHNRLGYYAEHLLAFWFSRAPHCTLLAHNLPVVSDGITVGAADFIVSLNGTMRHIELTAKYYGSRSGNTEDLCGLNSSDRFAKKAAKLTQQLVLLKFSDSIKTLSAHNLPQNLQPASIIRGIGFFPKNATADQPPFNPLAWQGMLLENWNGYTFPEHARYCLLDRMEYLAPARLRIEETQTAGEIQAIESGLIAELEHRPDGYWHETARIMKVSEK